MQIIHPWVAEGLHKIRAGVSVLGPHPDWNSYHNWVQTAEDLGFDSFWVPDHPPRLGDCWTRLAALAVSTRCIRLGSLVSCIFYYNPFLLAQMAADVDRWSGGRLVLGLGIGDQPSEFASMGLPYPSIRERQEALEEYIRIVRGVSGPTPFTFQGKYYQVEQSRIPFEAVQQPHIPLIIAGGGERVTLRQVAQYADASNFGPDEHTGSAFHLEDVGRKCQVLRSYCERFNRRADSVLRTHIVLPLVLGETPEALATKQEAMTPFLRQRFGSSIKAFTPSEAITYYKALVQAGIQYLIAGILNDDLETLHMFSQQVIPALNA